MVRGGRTRPGLTRSCTFGPGWQIKQGAIIGSGDLGLDPAAQIFLGDFTGVDFGEHDGADQNLAPQILAALVLGGEGALAGVD